ncbi:TetR/AcrR family transcriptional regulator C-terminal domain-containing protein [Agromyces silvae]|uniref:TetR/AcrR family transcriptional regulator C-terminal domain-containing protein n=1 Tax=Agromyces silvae TaxID=3388266 RepID=UPI00280B86CC|nr:TetR/AcrR family transcriptional regulator C-terminal domain-containing protein [Agromyces protaetiae]
MARLTRERLVTVALELVDDEGGEALSMRSLSARVDRQVSSLYNHVTSRDDLIEALRERVVAGIDTSAFAEQEWDAALAAWARSYLTAFAAHPNVIRLLTNTPIRDASTFDMYERVVAALLAAGWPVADAVAVMRAVEALVLGSALDIVAPADLLDQASVPPGHPAMHTALDPALDGAFGADRAFELGLSAVLTGLKARHAAVTGSPVVPD